MSNLNIFSILYRQPDQPANRLFQAQIVAATQDQAREVLWEHILEESPLIDTGAVEIVQISALGPVSAVPFPEMLPDHPALLAVAVLEQHPSGTGA